MSLSLAARLDRLLSQAEYSPVDRRDSKGQRRLPTIGGDRRQSPRATDLQAAIIAGRARRRPTERDERREK